VKLTGDFANTSEAIRIGDCFLFDSFAKNSSPRNFRLLQHYQRTADMAGCSVSFIPVANDPNRTSFLLAKQQVVFDLAIAHPHLAGL
jgi:hypothetical protein